MVLRRHSDEVGSDEPETSKRRNRDITNLPKECVEQFVARVEPVIRKVMREEMENCFRALFPSSRGLPFLTSPDPGRDWMLRFINQPLPKIYTGNKVEDKDSAPLQIEIVDVTTKTLVRGGPLSSLKLEIVVLDGDFDDDQEEGQREKYFSSRVLRAREGKKPLVTGELRFNLKDGVGCITDICCTDNSRWTRSGKFRLGVRVVPSSSRGSEVREAVSDAFSVKDRRGEACKKHQHPSLDDEVWRLMKIGKDGKFHKRLQGIGITTVREFLQMFESDPSLLKETLKCGNNTNRIWNAIIENATSCISHDPERYISHQATQKHVADYLGAGTSNNVTYQLSIGDVSMQSFMSLPAQSQPSQSSVPLESLYLPHNFPGHQSSELAPCYASLTSNFFGTNSQMEVPVLDLTEFNTDQEADVSISPSSGSTYEIGGWGTSEAMEGLIQPFGHQLPIDYEIQAESPNPFLWQISGSFGTPCSETDMELLSSLMSNHGSTRAAWCKLRAAVKCRILIRQSRVMKARRGKIKCWKYQN